MGGGGVLIGNAAAMHVHMFSANHAKLRCEYKKFIFWVQRLKSSFTTSFLLVNILNSIFKFEMCFSSIFVFLFFHYATTHHFEISFYINCCLTPTLLSASLVIYVIYVMCILMHFILFIRSVFVSFAIRIGFHSIFKIIVYFFYFC